jgi:hypothetical protein
MSLRKRNIIVAAIVVIVSFAWVFRNAPDSVASQKTVLEIDSKSLINAFIQDEKYANDKILGKVIQVFGVIELVTDN